MLHQRLGWIPADAARLRHCLRMRKMKLFREIVHTPREMWSAAYPRSVNEVLTVQSCQMNGRGVGRAQANEANRLSEL